MTTITPAAPRKDDCRALSAVEVAKCLRKELASAFPKVKFTVRTERGGSVRVEYNDGPTTARVEAIANRFNGKHFDGHDDSTTYAPPFLYEGEWVYTYCYVFVGRELSERFITRIVAAVSAFYGLEAPAVVEGWILPTHVQKVEVRTHLNCEWGDLIHRAARDRSSVAPALQPISA